MNPLLDALFPIIGSVIDKVIPNAAEREKAKVEMALKLAENELSLLKTLSDVDKAQIDLNKAEAQSPHFFVVGWRPMIGWVCAFSIAWMYGLQPLTQSVLFWCGKAATPGKLDSAGVLGLTASLLGMGGMRMMESLKGVERSNLKEF